MDEIEEELRVTADTPRSPANTSKLFRLVDAAVSQAPRTAIVAVRAMERYNVVVELLHSSPPDPKVCIVVWQHRSVQLLLSS